MNTIRECGCKGRRTCTWCEEKYNLLPDFVVTTKMKDNAYVYCPHCHLAWEGWTSQIIDEHPNHKGRSLPFSGVTVVDDFLSNDEANSLISDMDGEPWDPSQSGRRKQNYGPKCNFKKKKLAKGNFDGFPKFSLFVQDKFRNIPELEDFFVIEQCSLEYDPTKGASIDPHIDDCWIWGERIVTVNIIGDSVLSMIPYKGSLTKYNLDLVSTVPELTVDEDTMVRIFMPAKSLLILKGEARYSWEHCILREDTCSRRVCLAYREFTTPYLPGGNKEEEGQSILDISKLTLENYLINVH